MTLKQISAHHARVRTLVVVGVVLPATGLCSAATRWYAMLGRYLYVEDLELGLDEDTIFALTRITPTERGITIAGGVLALLGVAVLISAAFLNRGSRSGAPA